MGFYFAIGTAMKVGHENELNLETRTSQSTTQMARDEREGGTSSGNDDDEADDGSEFMN